MHLVSISGRVVQFPGLKAKSMPEPKVSQMCNFALDRKGKVRLRIIEHRIRISEK